MRRRQGQLPALLALLSAMALLAMLAPTEAKEETTTTEGGAARTEDETGSEDGAGSEDGSYAPTLLFKCCGAWEMLDGSGRRCVAAPWRREDAALRVAVPGHLLDRPLDARHVALWLPPGVSHRRALYVMLRASEAWPQFLVASVNASEGLDERAAAAEGRDYWARLLAPGRLALAPRGGGLLRADGAGGARTAMYCVDAAAPPLAPFAVQFVPDCLRRDCYRKCCAAQEVLALRGRALFCARDARGFWAPSNSSFARWLPPDAPFSADALAAGLCSGRPLLRLRLRQGDRAHAQLLRPEMQHFFSSWRACADFEAEEGAAALGETLLYCVFPREDMHDNHIT